MFLSFLFLLAPLLLLLRFLQDAAISLGHHNPDNHIPFWVITSPLLIVAAATTVYFYHKANKLRTVASVCPLLECCGVMMSLVAAVCKLQVQPPPPHDTKNKTANLFQTTIHHITHVPVPHPLQGVTPSSSWSEAFSFYIITTILSFVVGTIADFTSGAAVRRLPFTFIAAIIFILKLDDLSSHAYTNSP
jgi:hypothetical protein